LPTGSHPDRVPRRPAAFRLVDLGRQRLRVAVWTGEPGRVPLLLFNGIGASIEMLMPLAELLDGSLKFQRGRLTAEGNSGQPNHLVEFRVVRLIGK